MCIKIESPTAVHVVISRAVIKRGGGGVAAGDHPWLLGQVTPGSFHKN